MQVHIGSRGMPYRHTHIVRSVWIWVATPLNAMGVELSTVELAIINRRSVL